MAAERRPQWPRARHTVRRRGRRAVRGSMGGVEAGVTRGDVRRGEEVVEAWRLDPPSARTCAWALVLLSVATAVMLRAQLRAYTSVPDLGDPLFSMWRLAWVAHQLPVDPRHLFDANIFHPAARTLAYSDAMLAPAAFGCARVVGGRPASVRLHDAAAVVVRRAGIVDVRPRRNVSGQTGAAWSPVSCLRSIRSGCCTTAISSCSGRSPCRWRCCW